MQLSPFRIERFYARYEFTTRYMLSSSDCESRSIADLLELEPDAHARLLGQWCGYTESPGSPELRQAIAGLYQAIDPDDVLVTSSAEESIFLAIHALLRPGDHAIVETPCYESALQLARSAGADVGEWQRRYEDGWVHDVDALQRMLRPTTRLLYLNQPHNPTGTLMDRETFARVVELCRAHGAVLLCDEVYRELEHDPSHRLPAGCESDSRALSIGSISKTYGLPGLRIGWLVGRDAGIRQRLLELKDYTTICASAPSELLTALALRHRAVLADRNLEIVRENLGLLDAFIERHGANVDWVRPAASSIGFPRITGLGDVDELCERLAAGGVLLLPGSVYDQPQHVRVGYGRANLPEALAQLERLLATIR
jgi:aspartate/methionine/tyrosine aminotransferase